MDRLGVRLSRKIAAAALSAALLPLAACGKATGGHAASSAASSGSQANTSGTSGTSGSAASATAAGPSQIWAFYYQGQPTHEAELIKMGLDAFPQVFASSQLQVHLQPIADLSNLTQTLTGLINQYASPTSVFVCACTTIPNAVATASSSGYQLVQQAATANKDLSFYYSIGATSATSPAVQALLTALETIKTQALGRGKDFVTSYLQSNFGESPTHAQQTYASLAGQPVQADASDLRVDEVDFYPMLGWAPQDEYVTEVVTVTNVTENNVSSLSIPLLPGATDVHEGLWGQSWPPFTGPAMKVGPDGKITVQNPIPALQTVQISATYDVGAGATGDTWKSFTWTLPFDAKVVKLLLFNYYAQQGDGVTTNLPPMPGNAEFQVWGATNLKAGQSITFTAFTPSHLPLLGPQGPAKAAPAAATPAG
jgi:hypothetical protein